jgi:hypothetical protein
MVATMSNIHTALKATWDEIQDDIYEAEEDIRESMERLRLARKKRDDHIRYILFGVD